LELHKGTSERRQGKSHTHTSTNQSSGGGSQTLVTVKEEGIRNTGMSEGVRGSLLVINIILIIYIHDRYSERSSPGETFTEKKVPIMLTVSRH